MRRFWFENEESLIGSCGRKACYHLAVLLGKVVELRMWSLIAWVIAGGLLCFPAALCFPSMDIVPPTCHHILLP